MKPFTPGVLLRERAARRAEPTTPLPVSALAAPSCLEQQGNYIIVRWNKKRFISERRRISLLPTELPIKKHLEHRGPPDGAREEKKIKNKKENGHSHGTEAPGECFSLGTPPLPFYSIFICEKSPTKHLLTGLNGPHLLKPAL